MAKNVEISHFHYHFGHFFTPSRHVRITKTSLCQRGGSKDWFSGQYVKTCICGRTKIMWNTHKVGVTADNIVRYTASSLTVLRHSLILPCFSGKCNFSHRNSSRHVHLTLKLVKLAVSKIIFKKANIIELKCNIKTSLVSWHLKDMDVSSHLVLFLKIV